MSARSTVIWWLRRDLRLRDNLALAAAIESDGRVLPVFIFDPAILQGEHFGLPRLKFMLAGLHALDDDLRQRGGGLLVRHGDPRHVLPALVGEVGATAVFVNRDYTPYAVRRDCALGESLSVPFRLFDDAMLHPPEQTTKSDGTPFLVYTPYKRHWLALPKPDMMDSLPARDDLHDLIGLDAPGVPSLADLGFSDTIAVPPAGEAEAARRLERFADNAIHDYDVRRNIVSVNPFDSDAAGTSGLSPYFRFGMLSPRQARASAVRAYDAGDAHDRHAVEVWMSEIAWREFYMTILYRFPHAYRTSYRPEFERIAYRDAPDELAAWEGGRTGYPLVDAAMRQMHAIGWMHNRARMVVASFLTKHLLIYWRSGDLAFMRHLIDGDPAANSGGWQWAAGTGTDAQPYFRIFNPVIQSQKFDPDGAYIRRWVPELRDLSNQDIHEPWKLASPPKDYPTPIVDHTFARARALAAFAVLKKS
ncbi:MAG: deoxyribodipyrimidine photo-lyase [Chloroflexota bacterium]|nr:deoxyribodipyrimidine photo-lyase [Chloroflexota bacterium]